MEDELKRLSNEIKPDEDTKVDLYINKTPVKKSSWSILSIIGIFIIIFIIIIIVGISIYFFYFRSENDQKNEDIIHIDSDTSIVSNIS
jgi:flagellar basal body-associated protein FliL